MKLAIGNVCGLFINLAQKLIVDYAGREYTK